MIEFSVTVELTHPPEKIFESILDVDEWTTFTGWGPIPGIKQAEIHNPDDGIIGTRIDVTNTDGSTHQETITEFVPDERLIMRMDGFSAPLNKLASHFIEEWIILNTEKQTYLIRSFTLHPLNAVSSLVLRLIAIFLKRAINQHTEQIINTDAAR